MALPGTEPTVAPAAPSTPTATLLVVCCHAIYLDPTHRSDPLDESAWALAPFQRSSPAASASASKPGEHETFVRHVCVGLDELSKGSGSGEQQQLDEATLVFSGAATKTSVTPLSESRSYLHAALALENCPHPQYRPYARLAKDAYESGRLLLEEHATDSYQNLLFSILLFRRLKGRYPDRVCVITHAFKAKRFLELHAGAIGWPREKIVVLGVDPVMGAQDHASTLQSEHARGFLPWQSDPHGWRSPLADKRRERGWDPHVGVPLLCEGVDDPVKDLLRGELKAGGGRGNVLVDVGKMPWVR